ncbi:uncharacterized protein LOC132644105 [Lycium barbarum]|uniref:uncharacterized protein LOC132644105 n=1 Tax=Lycium barbarum TaxID=112863 RepID=UPI00293F6586|nr:uncharacterized protein LOC132644105 [Lycium barbarum]
MLLHQAQAELTRFLHLEEEYWKQKAGMKWFNDGDRNTKFFHSYVRGRRNKLTLKRIQDPSGTWLGNEVDIGSEAIRFFEAQFSEQNSGRDYALLKNIPKLITEEQQKNMQELPSESEVKEAVFSLNGDSASGPDGLIGQFYQKCWEVIKLDVIQMTGFVKGRSIAKNILLAQEIIRDINLRAKHTNVVIKLDMAKAYDRLSWMFLTKVLRQFGFGEVIIDLVWRLLSNNWYLVLINGQSHGFFRSSRGVKQGDPLSPTLVIIAAEVLTRSLNKLHEKPSFIGYGMPKWSPQINHLSYAYDTILFCFGDGCSLKLMMKRLRNYEKASGQLVNTDKSCYYIHHKVPARVNRRIKRHTKMRNGSFPFTYLGCPVFYGRRKLIYYEDLIKKVMKRILSWQNRLLSFGGRYVLINHVVQTMPVYLLSAMNPPSGVIKQLHKIFAKFLWSNTVGVKSKHWVAWDKLCLPKDEGGIGLRSLTDISKALFAKLWWNFRSGRSLWGSYMLNKYCKKWHPIMAIERGGSHTWKKMYENWTRLGALYYIIPDTAREEEIEVRQFVKKGEWNMELLTSTLDQELAQHIKENIKVPVEEEDDEPSWMLETNGRFSVKSAWEFLRHRESKQASIPTDGVGLHQMIMAWWTAETKPKLQPMYRAIPAVIMWSLWKRRNSIKYGGSVSFFRLKQQVQHILHQLIRKRFPWLHIVFAEWEYMHHHLSRYKPKFYYAKVVWIMPPSGRLKCNTDGASKGNPGLSSYGFCIRYCNGDLVYAEAQQMGMATNMEAETVALKQTLKFCKEHNLQQVQLETDSLLLLNIFQDTWTTPWELRSQIEEIKQDMRVMQVQINHIFREGNRLAYFLAS